jgi:hypothetical protein
MSHKEKRRTGASPAARSTSTPNSRLALIEEAGPKTQGDAGAIIATSASAGFDYANMFGEDRRDLQAAAARVKALRKTVVTNIIEIGKELIAAKAKLGHGRFGTWLEAEFDWTERTARNYIGAAEQFGDKSEIVSVLQPTAIYMLASPSTPEPVRKEVVRRIERGERVQTDHVRELVSEAKDKLREGKTMAKLPPKAREREAERRAKFKADAERREQEHKKEQEDAAAAATEIAAILRERLSDDLDHLLALCRTAAAGYMSLADLVELLEVEPPDEPTPMPPIAVNGVSAETVATATNKKGERE